MAGSCGHCQNDSATYSCVCGAVKYCSSTCQKSHWKLHKPRCPKFKITEIPGKGRGLVATRRIKVGEVIMEEAPLVCVDDGAHKISQILELSQSMSDDEKKKVLALHDSGENSNQQKLIKHSQCTDQLKDDIAEDGYKFARIVLCNGIDVCNKGNKYRVKAFAVYETISRMNHSCAPNSIWDSKKDDIYVVEVRAQKKIEKGMEITASYIDVGFMSRSERREILKSSWYFVCNCKLCSLDEDELRQNEELRYKIKIQDENILKFCHRGDVAEALSAAKEKVELTLKMDSDIIGEYDLLEALLLLYKLSYILGAKQGKGPRKKILEDQTNDYKNRAHIQAEKIGGSHMEMFENVCKKTESPSEES